MPAHPRDGAGGRSRKGRSPSGTVMTVILLTVVLLMAFAITAAILGFVELSAAAGMAAITLASEFIRRLLTITRSELEDTDNASVPPGSTGPVTLGDDDAR